MESGLSGRKNGIGKPLGEGKPKEGRLLRTIMQLG